MTKNAKLSAMAAAAIFASFAIMALMHIYGPSPYIMWQSGLNRGFSASAMWQEMGWMMLLGPVAMLLFFGGALILIVLFVKLLSKSD